MERNGTTTGTALVVFESMFGNTHVIADHVADGLRASFATEVTSAAAVTAEQLDAADLLVVGAPTHVHGLPGPRSRHAAADSVEKSPDQLVLEPDALGPGLRELFDRLAVDRDRPAAAFDTRIDAPAAFTGRASRGIARRLKGHGYELAADPQSFLVDKHNHLLSGEAERAEAWGRALGAHVVREGDRTGPPAARSSSR
jgi:hypothetical protein